MTKPFVFVVAALLHNEKGQCLLSQRPSHKPMSNFWEFPGGKVSQHELPDEALIRELKEELNITVVSQNLKPLTFVSYSYPDFHLFMPLYAINKWHGSIIPLEHQHIKWMSYKDLEKMNLLPADLPLIPFIKIYFSSLTSFF